MKSNIYIFSSHESQENGGNKSGAQPEVFHDRGGFLEKGEFDKQFIYNTQKKGLVDKNFGVFSPGYC